MTLGKVSSLGSYYTAAAFFPSDWRGQSSNSYQNKQATAQLQGRMHSVLLECGGCTTVSFFLNNFCLFVYLFDCATRLVGS